MTHLSVQSFDLYRIGIWRQDYELPVVIDECGYEGNIEFNWGNISAFEMVHSFWMSVARGGFCTHGETFYREDEVLWWAKGGTLLGKSAPRIAFLKELLYSLPADMNPVNRVHINPNEQTDDMPPLDGFLTALSRLPEMDRIHRTMQLFPSEITDGNYRLQYFGHQCPAVMDILLPDDGHFRVEIIDVWEMTCTVVLESAQGKTRIGMPGKEGIALLMTRLDGVSLK